MVFNRLVLALVALTATLQALSVWRDFRERPETRLSERGIIEPPAGASIDVAGLPSKGSLQAPVILVEFSDYECPFCAQHATGVGAEVDKEYLGTGQLRRVFANNPLAQHSHARLFARAALCGGEQGRYWDVHDALFRNRSSDISPLVGALGLKKPEFETCLQDHERHDSRIDHDVATARALHLTSTPAFAIGLVDSNQTVKLTALVIGAQPVDVFRRVIKQALSQPPVSH